MRCDDGPGDMARRRKRDSKDILALGGSANLAPDPGVPTAGSFPGGKFFPIHFHHLPPWREFAKRLKWASGQTDLSSNPSSASSV